jgi:hypothetical protein
MRATCFLALSLVLLAQSIPARAQTVWQAEGQTFEQRLDAALKWGAQSAGGEFWIGYQFPRRMYAHSRIGHFGSSPITLSEVLAGDSDTLDGDQAIRREILRVLEREEETPDGLVTKPLAILLRVSRGQVVKVDFSTMDASIDEDIHELAWAGDATQLESYRLLMSRRPRGVARSSGDYVAAVGMHEAVPEVEKFLVAMATEPGDVGEVARYSLAAVLAARLGLRPDVRDQSDDAHLRRQALYALANARSDGGIPLFVQLVESGTDREVRRQALMQLGYSDERGAMEALLKLSQQR